MFMKLTSFAAHNGIKAWTDSCAKRGGSLLVAETERMSIVQQFRDPINELGRLLHSSGRIDQLCISFQVSNFQISFIEYLLEELLTLDDVRVATCFFASSLVHNLTWANVDDSQLKRWEDLLRLNPPRRMEESHLPLEMDHMYRLLCAIRMYQQLGSLPIPPWLSPMPA